MLRHAVLALPLVLLAAGPADRPLYKDPSQPVERRVADLLGRMTLEEKVAQTLAVWKRKERITDEEGRFAPARAAEVLGNGIGQIARPSELRDRPKRIVLGPRENAVFVNAVQKWLVESTRLGSGILARHAASDRPPEPAWPRSEALRANQRHRLQRTCSPLRPHTRALVARHFPHQ